MALSLFIVLLLWNLLIFETSFCAGYVEDEEQACRWDHHKKEKE
jgi:hypothetical protein